MLLKSMVELGKGINWKLSGQKKGKGNDVAIMLKVCYITMMLTSGSNGKKLRKSHKM